MYCSAANIIFELITVLLFCTRSSHIVRKDTYINLLRVFFYMLHFSHLACSSSHKFLFAPPNCNECSCLTTPSKCDKHNIINQRDSCGFPDAFQFHEQPDDSSDNKCLNYCDCGPPGEVRQAAEEATHHRRGSRFTGQCDQQSAVVSHNYSTQSSD